MARFTKFMRLSVGLGIAGGSVVVWYNFDKYRKRCPPVFAASPVLVPHKNSQIHDSWSKWDFNWDLITSLTVDFFSGFNIREARSKAEQYCNLHIFLCTPVDLQDCVVGLHVYDESEYVEIYLDISLVPPSIAVKKIQRGKAEHEKYPDCVVGLRVYDESEYVEIYLDISLVPPSIAVKKIHRGKAEHEKYPGRAQAKMTGERLKELNFPYSCLIHSTMTRAVETARIIQQSLPFLGLQESPLLEEGSPIPPDPPSKVWKPPNYFHQDGARIEAAFRKYFHRADSSQENDSYDIIVCHANVIRYFVCRALQLPPEAWLRFSLRHASITWITINYTGRVSLRMYGDAGFMPPSALTTI